MSPQHLPHTTCAKRQVWPLSFFQHLSTSFPLSSCLPFSLPLWGTTEDPIGTNTHSVATLTSSGILSKSPAFSGHFPLLLYDERLNLIRASQPWLLIRITQEAFKNWDAQSHARPIETKLPWGGETLTWALNPVFRLTSSPRKPHVPVTVQPSSLQWTLCLIDSPTPRTLVGVTHRKCSLLLLRGCCRFG